MDTHRYRGRDTKYWSRDQDRDRDLLTAGL